MPNPVQVLPCSGLYRIMIIGFLHRAPGFRQILPGFATYFPRMLAVWVCWRLNYHYLYHPEAYVKLDG
jgi:hypothetical protein